MNKNNDNGLMPEDVLNFWFSDQSKHLWFVKNKKFDNQITNRFSKLYGQAASGMLDSWQYSPNGILALIIILDQFPRNMFRDLPKSFDTDHQALALTKYAIEQGFDIELPNDEYRSFLYMPLMHSERLADQKLGLKLFTGNALKFARMHLDIIEKFGRFPHRNKILNRESTFEEEQFLNQPNSSF